VVLLRACRGVHAILDACCCVCVTAIIRIQVPLSEVNAIFSILAKMLAGKSVPKMTHLVSSGALNRNSINQTSFWYL